MGVDHPRADHLGLPAKYLTKLLKNRVDQGFTFCRGVSHGKACVSTPIPVHARPAPPGQPGGQRMRLTHLQPDTQLKLAGIQIPQQGYDVLPLQRIILQQKGSGQTIFLHQRDLLLHRQCQIQGAIPGLRAANEMHEIQPIIQEKHPSFFFAAAIISTWETLRQ